MDRQTQAKEKSPFIGLWIYFDFPCYYYEGFEVHCAIYWKGISLNSDIYYICFFGNENNDHNKYLMRVKDGFPFTFSTIRSEELKRDLF